jgi:hypothetical protein
MLVCSLKVYDVSTCLGHSHSLMQRLHASIPFSPISCDISTPSTSFNPLISKQVASAVMKDDDPILAGNHMSLCQQGVINFDALDLFFFNIFFVWTSTSDLPDQMRMRALAEAQEHGLESVVTSLCDDQDIRSLMQLRKQAWSQLFSAKCPLPANLKPSTGPVRYRFWHQYRLLNIFVIMLWCGFEKNRYRPKSYLS